MNDKERIDLLENKIVELEKHIQLFSEWILIATKHFESIGSQKSQLGVLAAPVTFSASPKEES